MGTNTLLGIILLVVGAIFLYLGLRATDSVAETITEGLTGKFSDSTTWYVVGGAVAVAVGGGLLLFRGRSQTA